LFDRTATALWCTSLHSPALSDLRNSLNTRRYECARNSQCDRRNGLHPRGASRTDQVTCFYDSETLRGSAGRNPSRSRWLPRPPPILHHTGAEIGRGARFPKHDCRGMPMTGPPATRPYHDPVSRGSGEKQPRAFDEGGRARVVGEDGVLVLSCFDPWVMTAAFEVSATGGPR
jgi:hypothetical protein